MELGVRIAERLVALDISQSELARRANIPQTTINSLINKPRRSSPHLIKIARELHTTPAYLTGDVDDPDEDVPPASGLNSEEREWLDLLGNLEPKDRAAVLTLTRSLANSARSPTVHAPGLEYHAGRPEEQRLGGGKAQHTKKQGGKEQVGQAGAVR